MTLIIDRRDAMGSKSNLAMLISLHLNVKLSTLLAVKYCFTYNDKIRKQEDAFGKRCHVQTLSGHQLIHFLTRAPLSWI